MARPAHAKRNIVRDLIEIVILVAVAVGVAFALRTFVIEPFVIPSASMVDTLEVGDRIFGEKITYANSDPARGDIVTFEDPEGSGTILIKRVIAVAGQTVTIEKGNIYVDGVKLAEQYTDGKETYALDAHGSNLDANIEYPYTVPEGYIWVMGDNRTNSLDSRYFGAIPISSVTSRALVIYWPFDRISEL